MNRAGIEIPNEILRRMKYGQLHIEPGLVDPADEFRKLLLCPGRCCLYRVNDIFDPQPVQASNLQIGILGRDGCFNGPDSEVQFPDIGWPGVGLDNHDTPRGPHPSRPPPPVRS